MKPLRYWPRCATMARTRDLTDLLSALRGEMPHNPDWERVLTLANRTLCTPAIAAQLRGNDDFPALPSDVRRFLLEILSRNDQRNERLFNQLSEACAIMNGHGVRPVLLKGSAWLASADAADRSRRILTDLDLMVPAEAFHTTIDRLTGAGYQLEAPVLRPEVPAVLWRPQDAGTIDLHTEYGSAATLLYQFKDLASDAEVANLPGSVAMLPSAVACAAILLLHDQLKGRDYLRGRVDLRHLADLDRLAAGLGPAQWRDLEALFSQPYARKAMKTQFLTARKLLRTDIPDALVDGISPRLQYWRRLLQIRWPGMAAPLTLLSMLDPAYIATRSAAKRRRPVQEGGSLPRRESLKRLFFRNEVGKI